MNPLKIETEVVRENGDTVKLVFDLNAWIDIADELGMEVPDVLEKLGDEKDPPGWKFQRVIMWGGLRKHHPEMTIRDAGEIMSEAAGALADALPKALPQGDEQQEEEEPEGDEAELGPRLVAGASIP